MGLLRSPVIVCSSPLKWQYSSSLLCLILICFCLNIKVSFCKQQNEPEIKEVIENGTGFKYIRGRNVSFHKFNLSDVIIVVSDEALEKIRPTYLKDAIENKGNMTIMTTMTTKRRGETRPFFTSALGLFLDYVISKPMLSYTANFNPIEYQEVRPPTRACRCGDTTRTYNMKIYGGSSARVHEFPWRVFLESGFGLERVLCGGTLISNQWILTAASCIFKRANFVMVHLGDHDRAISGEARSFITVASQWIMHPEYDEATHDFDIALIKLTSPMETRESFHPVCLPWKSKYKDYTDAVVTASGWGIGKEGAETNNILTKIAFPVMLTHECRHFLSKANRSATDVTMNMMCTHRKDAQLCKGDFGSSLDYFDPVAKVTYAVAIPVDLDYKCNGSDEDNPQVATKIGNFLDWIYVASGYADFCVM